MERPHSSCDQLLHARVPWHGDELVAVMAKRCNAIVHFDQLCRDREMITFTAYGCLVRVNSLPSSRSSRSRERSRSLWLGHKVSSDSLDVFEHGSPVPPLEKSSEMLRATGNNNSSFLGCGTLSSSSECTDFKLELTVYELRSIRMQYVRDAVSLLRGCDPMSVSKATECEVVLTANGGSMLGARTPKVHTGSTDL